MGYTTRGCSGVLQVSYLYFSIVGMAVTIAVAMVVSFLTGANRLEEADPDLFSPVVAHFLPRRRKQREEAAATPLELEQYKAVPTS